MPAIRGPAQAVAVDADLDLELWERVLDRRIDVAIEEDQKLISVARDNFSFVSTVNETCIPESVAYVANDAARLMSLDLDAVMTAFPIGKAHKGVALRALRALATAYSGDLGMAAAGMATSPAATGQTSRSDALVVSLGEMVDYGPVDALGPLAGQLRALALRADARAQDAARDVQAAPMETAPDARPEPTTTEQAAAPEPAAAPVVGPPLVAAPPPAFPLAEDAEFADAAPSSAAAADEPTGEPASPVPSVPQSYGLSGNDRGRKKARRRRPHGAG